jgi:hypothetical protein
VIRKFFPLDKNYVLESVQLSLKQPLLEYLVDFVKIEYLLQHNPLGIEDEMSQRIKQHTGKDFRHLDNFYLTLAGLFRYERYHDNQLTFIFDGEEPSVIYSREWTDAFKSWVKQFCKKHQFLRAVLDLTVFYPVDSPVVMADNRMEAFIAQQFDIKIHPQKGIIKKAG